MRNTTFKSALAAALLLATVTAAAPASSATPTTPARPSPFSGTATLESDGTFDFVAGCAFVHTINDGTFTGELNGTPGANPGDTGTVHIEQCVEQPIAGSFPATGTFVITTDLGTLSGLFFGLGCGSCTPFTDDFDLVVTHGTGAYFNAAGTITLQGTTTFDGTGFHGSDGMTADVGPAHGPMMVGSSTGSFAGSYAFGVGGCFLQTVTDGTFAGELDGHPGVGLGDSGSGHFLQCVNVVDNLLVGTGTFEQTNALGTMHGTSSSWSVIGDPHTHVTLVVTGGTGAYRNATGTIWAQNITTLGPNQTFAGTSTGIQSVTTH